MRMHHGGEHVEEQPHAGREAEGMLLAVALDRQAVDVLEHEVGLRPVGRDAGVEQVRDVRVREPREKVAVARKALPIAV